MTTNQNQTSAERAPRGRQRFSDRIEFRRGKRDAEQGRAPACLASHYMAGYTQGRRQSQRASR